MALVKTKEGCVLVLCIDRDDDLGVKAGVSGPIIGEEANLEAARRLALSDPEDTDSNAIFAAVKTKRECEREYNDVEVVTLTGDIDVGVKSDRKLGDQLSRVLDKFKPKGVVFVTDGVEDAEILPVIQSEVKILSVKSVNVKAARGLESAYSKLQDFFHRVSENPHQAKMIFGLPGLLIFTIVFLSWLGFPILEIILALAGVYLLAKGFGYDKQLFSGIHEVGESMINKGNIYKVFNAVAIAVFMLGIVTGYLQVQENLGVMQMPGTFNAPASVGDVLTTQPAIALNFFLFSSSGSDFSALDLMLAALVIAAMGFMIHNFLRKNYLGMRKYIYLIILAILLAYLAQPIYWSVIYLQPDAVVEGLYDSALSKNPVQTLLISLLVSMVALLVTHYLLKIIFFDYISKKESLEKKYAGKKILDAEGKEIGEVTKVVVSGGELEGIMSKKRFFAKARIRKKGDNIIVESD